MSLTHDLKAQKRSIPTPSKLHVEQSQGLVAAQEWINGSVSWTRNHKSTTSTVYLIHLVTFMAQSSGCSIFYSHSHQATKACTYSAHSQSPLWGCWHPQWLCIQEQPPLGLELERDEWQSQTHINNIEASESVQQGKKAQKGSTLQKCNWILRLPTVCVHVRQVLFQVRCEPEWLQYLQMLWAVCWCIPQSSTWFQQTVHTQKWKEIISLLWGWCL